MTIVIPCFNEQRLLASCLESLAAQTVRPAEVLLVDNNSTDDSLSIARRFPFVKVIREPRQGIVFARDAGFNAAKHGVIGRIDADSVLPPDWVQRVARFYQVPANHRRALTGGGYFYNMRLPRLNGWWQGQLAYRVNRLIIGHYILWGSNMAITRSAWRAVSSGLCRRTDIHEDIDLSIHLRRAGFSITYLENLRVGTYLKRVWDDKGDRLAHLNRWPRTLRLHDKPLWWMGVLGNIWLAGVLIPLFMGIEYLARLAGRKPLV